MLRPVIRLALKAGVKYSTLDEVVRECLFTEAQTLGDASVRANASRLSVITGMHRKDISARIAQRATARTSDDPITRNTMVSRVFSRWADEVRRNPRAKTISVAGRGVRGKNFVALANEVVKDVHPRAVLDELVRLGFAREADGKATLLTDLFSPKGSADDQLALFTRNTEAMLETGVENVLASRPPQLEYSIGTKNISRVDAERIAEIASSHWKIARDAIYEAIRDVPEIASPSDQAFRIRVGTYVNFREDDFQNTDFINSK